jgi:hypothetical protein
MMQHLHIKAFLRTSDNAIKTQSWIAVCTEVLTATQVNRKIKRHVFVPAGMRSPAQGRSAVEFWGSGGLTDRILSSRSAAN